MTTFPALKSLARLAVICIAPFACVEGRSDPSSADAPHYQPRFSAAGMIKVFGDPFHGTMPQLERGFQKYCPGILFASTPIGSECGFAGLYTGCGDIAPLADPPTRDNYMAFFETFRYVPTQIVIASGSLKTLPPPIIFVNAANPLARLTMDQLDQIFSAERLGTWRPLIFTGDFARGPETNLRTWGQLGLTGEWADKPIQTYGYATRTAAACFFEERVFHGSIKWNGNYREYDEPAPLSDKASSGEMPRDAAPVDRLLEDLSNDRYSIGWAVVTQADGQKGLKALAIAASDTGPFFAPTARNIRSRLYPLTRDISVYFKRPPDGSVDPNVREFLRFVLSPEGQQIVAKAAAYYPLPSQSLREEAAKLQ